MSLICFKNGSLAREKIKNYFNLNWKQFSSILRKTPPGNYGKIILPYFLPEIVPMVLKPKVFRYNLNENDMEGNVRAIIEAQFLTMRLHSSWIGEKPKEIYATAGASANEEILQIAADIFNTKIRAFSVTNSAALGAALRAVKSYYDCKRVKISWADIANRFLKIQESKIIKPKKEHKALYDDMLALYGKCENFFLKNGENPNSYHNKFVKKYFKG
jgi:xylulokinase